MTIQQLLTTTVTMNRDTSARGVSRAFAILIAAWIVSTFGTTPAAAQVFPGSVILTTQTQVDNFSYAEVTGDVLVRDDDDGLDPITNLDGLSRLTTIGGSLGILSNHSLTNVDGLSNVTVVPGGLGINGNDLLTHVDGLSGITSVGGALAVMNNASLADFDGLSGLTSVGGLLLVRHNSSLTNVDGLSNLTWVGGDLGIDDNGSLMDVNGLSSLTSIAGTLFIASNALKNVDGLSAITSVAGGLGIANNGLLTDVDGLSGLRTVGGNLRFSGNFSLTDLDGVSGLETVGGSLMILSNFELTEFCGLYRLLAGDGLGGNYEVNSNGKNPSVQDILDEGPCDPADTIGDLLAEGAINEGMAMALLHVADNSLEGLAGILTGFVQSGILTPLEAQLLFAIASSWQDGI